MTNLRELSEPRISLSSSVLGGVLGAVASLGLAAPAFAGEVSSGNDRITLELSGQINRAVLYADDGDNDDIFHVDNDNSSTRVRFVGAGRVNDDFSVGTQFEVQFESNSTADIKMDQDSSAGDNNFTERKLEFYLDSKSLGRLWVGQGDTASNGTSEVDLSGTAVVGYSGIADFAGGLEFGGEGGREIGGAWSQMDGFSRDDRIRYDTPNFAGFMASAGAFESGNGWDVALRYASEIAGFQVAGAAAYGETDSFDSQINGSLSVLHETGINVTGAVGQRKLDTSGREDPFFWYAKLGYIMSPFDLGDTAIAVDFGQADDVSADDDEIQTWGLFLVQKVDVIATEFYAGFRNHSLDQSGGNPDDINGAMVGARIKF